MDELFKFSKEGVPITIIGLPYAGKTTLVNWLKEKKFTRPKPTVGLSFEQIKMGDVNFNIFDLSGQESFRESLWESYIRTSLGIIFVVDSSDRTKLEEASKWFWKVINEWLQGIFSEKIVLFIANKSDLIKSINLEEIISLLDLNQMSKIPDISFQIFKTSIRNGSNLELAIRWFFNKAKQQIRKQAERPSAVIITDKDGQPIYVYNPAKLVDEAGMLIGYLSALSGFSDEILGEERFKAIMVEPYYYFVSQDKNYVISVAVKSENSLPEARRITNLIREFLLSTKLNNNELANFIEQFLL